MIIMYLDEVQANLKDLLKEAADICERHNITYFLCCGSALGAQRHGDIIPWDHDIDIGVPYNELDRFLSIMQKELKEPYYVNYYGINKKYYRLAPRLCIHGINSIDLHIDIFPHIGLPQDIEQQKSVYSSLKKLVYIFALKQDRPYRTMGSWSRRIIKLKRAIQKMLLFRSADSIFNEYCTLCEQTPYESAQYTVNSNWQYSFEREVIDKSLIGSCKKVPFSDFEVRVPQENHKYLTQMYGDYMTPPPREKTEKLLKYEIIIEKDMPDAYR